MEELALTYINLILDNRFRRRREPTRNAIPKALHNGYFLFREKCITV